MTAPPSGVASGTPATIEPVPLENTGTVSVAKGQKLLLNGAPATFAAGTTLAGTGRTVIQEPVTASGTLTLGTGATLDMDEGGSVDGIAGFAGSGTLQWTGGALSGTLTVTFAGTSPGTGFGQLDVSAAVTQAGQFAVGTSGGFTPPGGQPFKVLLYGSRSGRFGKLSSSPAYTVSYHPTVMDVVFG